MKRRAFLGGLGVAGVWPAAVFAQHQPTPIVGFVGFANADVDAVTVNAFRKALIGLGHVEGRTIIVSARSADGDVALGHAMIDELAALPVDVFLFARAGCGPNIVRKTKIPVVAVALPVADSDPELFQSLARPGGTVTGFAAFGEEMSAKRIEMLKAIVPGLRKLGVMHNSTDPTFSAWGTQTMTDATRAGIEPMRLGLSGPSAVHLTEQIKTLADEGGTAMIVIRDFLTSALMKDICKIAADARIAVVGEHAEIARAGALFSYGADLAELFRRAASYVDNILKGQKPGEMPIQLPTKFELIVNVKVAQTLGLAIPLPILVLADQLIE